MPAYRVVLVDPIYPENVGYVARAMGNHGVDDLVLVRGCELTGKARERATHSTDILERARRVEDLDAALEGVDLSVATTARPGQDPKKHHRETIGPGRLRERLEGVQGRVALVFGREDYGLYNEEVARLDLAVHLPVPGRRSMNLGHAVVVLLFALRAGEHRLEDADKERPLAGDEERRHLDRAFRQLLDVIAYPDHKRFRTTSMWRRVTGRAMLSQWEYHRLMGVLSQTLYKLGSPFDDEVAEEE